MLRATVLQSWQNAVISGGRSRNMTRDNSGFDALSSDFASQVAEVDHVADGRKLESRELEFILAGNATFTLRSARTGTRYTYKVTKHETRDVFYVKMLTGENNEADYTYVGMIAESRAFRLTHASKLPWQSRPVQAFNFTYAALQAGKPLNGHIEVWHAGKCGRCGRKLTVPESIASGFGPDCSEKMGG